MPRTKLVVKAVPQEDILPVDEYMAATFIQFVKWSGIPETKALKIFDVPAVKAAIKDCMSKRYLPGMAAEVITNRFITRGRP